MLASIRAIPAYFLRPASLLRGYRPANLRPDLLAGITVAVILLPQAIAFALIADLPPVMGLYTAVVGAVVGALWGSSAYTHTGPTSALSLLVLFSLSTIAPPDSTLFLVTAGLVAVMVGIFQLVMGLARLGILVNFVSDSVIVGFAAGAGIQIAAGELRHLLGLELRSRSLVSIVQGIATQLPQTHLPTLALGVGTVVLILLLQRLRPALPASLIGLVAASLLFWLVGLERAGVRALGPLPSSLPPLSVPPVLNLGLIGELSSGALAVAAIGLIQTMAVARSLAAQSGGRLDNNQEFVGQGLANIACGFLSGFPCSGSFSRSAVNYKAGAATPMAAIFSGLFVLLAMLTLSPLGAYLPRAALAGVLVLVAYGMIDQREMRRIWRGARGDAAIMLVTLFGTLFLPLQFAVLAGILMSLAYYILKTSAPRVHPVVPDSDFRHFVHEPAAAQCPQLGILDILGDLYFGAVSHVEEEIRRYQAQHERQRFLLLRMGNVHHCDISGIHMLENILRSQHERGGDLFLTGVRPPVLRLMRATGFLDHLGADHCLGEDEAIEYLFYKILDPAVCIYESDVRVFRECQNLPRPDYQVRLIVPGEIGGAVAEIAPRDLWRRLREPTPPRVVDVREPREWAQGHIPQATLHPLPTLLDGAPDLALNGAPVVFVCRSGRRSSQAAALVGSQGQGDVAVLAGGMLAWEAAGLLVAVG